MDERLTEKGLRARDLVEGTHIEEITDNTLKQYQDMTEKELLTHLRYQLVGQSSHQSGTVNKAVTALHCLLEDRFGLSSEQADVKARES